MLIAVDGYNFIKQSPQLRRMEQMELRKAREGLIQQLSQYKRIKGHSILVVFDGSQEGGMGGERDRSQGIEIIFSRAGEKADDVLKRLAAAKREGVTIVTSDREVVHYAEKKGAAAISTADFAEKMEMARLFSIKGEVKDGPDRAIAPLKKGPSRRLSKSRRRTAAAAKKL